MINYGLPYKGSKSAIAADIIRFLPSGKRFVDVFAGGCAMTHAAILAGRWGAYLCNDIADIPLLFADAIAGKYRDEKRWVSRQDFAALKDTDLYVRVSWSFGNNCKNYLYSAEIEPYKRACHYAVVFDDWGPLSELCPEVWQAAQRALKGLTDMKARRLAFGPSIVRRLKALKRPDLLDANPLYRSVRTHKHPDATYLERLERLQSLESLESLQSLERLERLQSLQSLQSLGIQARKGDYRTLEIREGDVLYCDPPYIGTDGYDGGFDHREFYDWVEAQSVPVYISEYEMPSDRFMCIWRKPVMSRLTQKGSTKAEERLYVPRKRK